MYYNETTEGNRMKGSEYNKKISKETHKCYKKYGRNQNSEGALM